MDLMDLGVEFDPDKPQFQTFVFAQEGGKPSDAEVISIPAALETVSQYAQTLTTLFLLDSGLRELPSVVTHCHRLTV